DALPTVQIDGVVWAQVVVGNTVYVGGKFTTARPAGSAPGTNTTPRNNLLAYNISTGQLSTSFAPTLNGQVLGVAASPDGSRVYAVGDFTTVNGERRYRAVALNSTNGSVVSSFTPGINARTRSVVATNDTVYLGGIFTNVSGVTRTRLAAVRASTGAVLDWAPSAAGGGNQVMALALTPDRSKLIVGGSFTSLNGNTALGLGAVDPATGATLPWNAANTVKNSGSASAITSLVAGNDSIYGTGYVYGTDPGLPKGNLEGSFSASANSGDIRWVNSCRGDSYGTFPFNGVSYSVGHAHDCRDTRGFAQTVPWIHQRGIAMTDYATQTSRRTIDPEYFNWEGTPSPSELPWYPDLAAGTFTGQQQAAWSIAGNSDYLVLGGEFERVNGVPQQGLVRFARKGLAPNKSGPQLSGSDFQPALTSPASGLVRGSIPANYDGDNERLSYKVYRQGVAEPVHTENRRSRFWKRPMITFSDSSLTPGQTYRYRVEAVDPFGNRGAGDWTDVTVASTGTLSDYAKAVMDDGPTFYWQFNETSGIDVEDSVGRIDGTRAGSVTRGVAGAIPGDPNAAYEFAGENSGSRAYTATQLRDQQEFAIDLWIKTATNSGGRIIGFSDGTTGTSEKSDRHLYMRDDGKLSFGAMADSMQTITSSASYNDNEFHHVVVQMSVNGMQLYVDGEEVASDPSAYGSTEYNGYWRIGGDGLTGWPGQPTSDYFAGIIDEVALYPQALTRAQVANHWLSALGVPNQPPTALLSATVDHLTVAFDSSGSTDPDGSITSYAWDFGDGRTGSGATVNHTYEAPGSYNVTVSVTDSRSATAQVSTQVTVLAAPTAGAPPRDSTIKKQRVTKKPATVGRGRSKALPQRSSAGVKVQWKSLTPRKCVVRNGKVYGRNVGKCKLKAIAEAQGPWLRYKAITTVRVR
ncbi:MAG: LamG-like jellyroll fold domain-containing protein, partial [Candidatus Nanopelagicales bacterium]